MSFMDARPHQPVIKKKKERVSEEPRGESKKLFRKKALDKQDLNLKSQFKVIKVSEFVNYCGRVFGHRPANSTVYSHNSKPWSKIPEHWQIKYLAFFHHIKNS